MGFNPRLAPYSFAEIMTKDPGTASEEFHLFRFPVAGRVLDAYAVNTAGIADTTDTVALHLYRYSNAATATVSGTLGSWAAGTTWVTDVPKQMLMTSVGSTAQFVKGEWIRLGYTELTSGLWTEMGIQVDYVLGYDV